MLRAKSSHLYRDSVGSDLNLNSTMGMILIGLIVDAMYVLSQKCFVLGPTMQGRLYGIMFFQTYLYITSGTKDRTCLRALVSFCCAALANPINLPLYVTQVVVLWYAC